MRKTDYLKREKDLNELHMIQRELKAKKERLNNAVEFYMKNKTTEPIFADFEVLAISKNALALRFSQLTTTSYYIASINATMELGEIKKVAKEDLIIEFYNASNNPK